MTFICCILMATTTGTASANIVEKPTQPQCYVTEKGKVCDY